MLAVAFISSNQDRNIGALPGHNEAGNTRILAHDAAQKAMAAGLSARYFEPALESTDKTEYASLYTTFGEAKAWLDAQAAMGRQTACVHVHTNAAARPQDGSSHTGYCYSTAVDASKTLGYLIASKVGLVLGLGLLAYDYTGWLFDTLLRPHPSTIIELTRHDRRADLEHLYQAADAVEGALVEGVLAWAGESPAAPTETDTLRRQLADVTAERDRYKAALNKARSIVATLDVALQVAP